MLIYMQNVQFVLFTIDKILRSVLYLLAQYFAAIYFLYSVYTVKCSVTSCAARALLTYLAGVGYHVVYHFFQ